MDTQEIILKDGNFVRREITEQVLGSQDQVLASLVEQVPVMLKNFMNHGGSSVHVLISKNHVILATELPKLPFTTYWSLNAHAPGTLVPVWQQMQGAVRIDEAFTVPAEWGKAIFFQKFDRESFSGRPGLTQSLCYLALYNGGELYHIPYPNNYSDGRLCMGPEWDVAIINDGNTKDCYTAFALSLASFLSTQMNNHLTTELTVQTFQRDLDGWAVNKKANERFPRISNAFFTGFAL